jgi:hypothetical protein
MMISPMLQRQFIKVKLKKVTPAFSSNELTGEKIYRA